MSVLTPRFPSTSHPRILWVLSALAMSMAAGCASVDDEDILRLNECTDYLPQDNPYHDRKKCPGADQECIESEIFDEETGQDVTVGLCSQRCGTSDYNCDPGLICESGVCVTYDGEDRLCTEDATCREGWFCDDGQCQQKLIDGASCAEESQCRSANCVDGLCCISACDGLCQSCAGVATGDLDGACADVTEGLDPRDDCFGEVSCRGDGECELKNPGGSCDDSDECATGFCVDGFCCESACDASCEACAESLTGQDNGLCRGTPDTEASPDECPGATVCKDRNECWAEPNGDQCSSDQNEDLDYRCASGECVDGRCCAQECSGVCQRCDANDDYNTCTATVNQPDSGTCDSTTANGECAEPPCSCDAEGACKQSAATTCSTGDQCASGSCVDGVCCETACDGLCMSCNGTLTNGEDGTCLPLTDGLDVRDECNGTGPLACENNGNQIVGSCYDKALGDECTADFQCLSENCVDGFCCDGGCDGVCEACSADLTGLDNGACNSVISNVDTNTCDTVTTGGNCDGGPCVCDAGGVCTHIGGALCEAGDECESGSCRGGVCCNETCEGTCFSCNAEQTDAEFEHGECAQIPEGEDFNDECPGVAACDRNGSGALCFERSAGDSCSQNYQCGSGFCADGVCCDSACDGTCVTCAGGDDSEGAAGVCSFIDGGQDPVPSDEFCDGAEYCVDGACKLPDGATCGTDDSICDSGECTDGVCCESSCTGLCDSCDQLGFEGQCLQDPAGTDCSVGGMCDSGGECVDRDDGATCSSDINCESNACERDATGTRDNICCEYACGDDEACVGGVCKKGGYEECSINSECASGDCINVEASKYCAPHWGEICVPTGGINCPSSSRCAGPQNGSCVGGTGDYCSQDSQCDSGSCSRSLQCGVPGCGGSFCLGTSIPCFEPIGVCTSGTTTCGGNGECLFGFCTGATCE